MKKTVKLTPDMTRHDAAILVFDRILQQGGKSELSGSGTCAYRGDKNRRCGVGFLIKDKVYSQSLENCTPVDGSVQNAVNDSQGFKVSVDFLCALQDAHDSIWLRHGIAVQLMEELKRFPRDGSVVGERSETDVEK